MPLAVAHFVASMGMMRLLRLNSSRLLFSKEMFLCALFGILPDADIALSALLTVGSGRLIAMHRQYTHTFVIAAALLLAGYLFWDRHEKLAKLLLLAGSCYALHVFLDILVCGKAPIFWPISSVRIGHGFTADRLAEAQVLISVDAVLLLSWLWLRAKCLLKAS